MSNVVEYILNLKSNQFESGVSSAIGSTNRLESAMSSVKNAAMGFFGAYAGFEFISSSVEMFNDAAKASAQLDSALRSTANAGNLNRKALDEQADALMHKSLFDDDAITASQALLATFTQVKDKIFMDAIPAIADMSQALGMDLLGATTMVGKALNDPIKGINAMSRAGVSFTEGQKELIKSLVETNHVAEAQSMILKELQTEYGGSAEAASQVGTGPLMVLKNEFNDTKEAIGELVMTFVNNLRPQLEWFIGWMSNSVTWIKEHTSTIKAVVLGWLAMRGTAMTLIPLMEGYAMATATATTATAELAVAETAALGPIGLLAVAVGGLVVAYNMLTDAQDEAVASRAKGYESQTQAYEASLASRMEEQWKQSHKSRVDYIKETNATLADAIKENDRLLGLAMRNGGDVNAISDRGVDLLHTKNALAMFEKNTSTAPRTMANAPTTGTASVKPIKSSATGSRSITFNIQINDLIKTLNFNVTNVKESANKIKEYVGEALLQTVNDFQHAIPE